MEMSISIKKIESQERKVYTGAPLRKVIYWTLVDENGVARDGLFKTRKNAERALRNYAA